jgi:peptidoglycan-associated lipoprotein
MKHLLFLALLGALLAGCADTPLKEASIEDRALVSSSQVDGGAALPDKAAGDASAGKSVPATTSGLANDNISSKTIPAGVETRGVDMQSPEAKPLDGAGQTAAATEDRPGSGATDHADGLKYQQQPVLDPKDPQSPLAERRLFFEYDSSVIRDEYRTLLELHAQYLKQEQAAKLILQGHADERGSREYNLALGQRRAESVYRALNLLGVADAQMEAVSLGEEKPLVEGHDESAWSQNRRTELLYQGE